MFSSTRGMCKHDVLGCNSFIHAMMAPLLSEEQMSWGGEHYFKDYIPIEGT